MLQHENTMLTEISKRKNAVWFHFYEVPRTVKFIDIESRMLVARVGADGRRGGELSDGYGFSVLQDEKGSGDWLYNSMYVLNVIEPYTKKW